MFNTYPMNGHLKQNYSKKIFNGFHCQYIFYKNAMYRKSKKSLNSIYYPLCKYGQNLFDIQYFVFGGFPILQCTHYVKVDTAQKFGFFSRRKNAVDFFLENGRYRLNEHIKRKEKQVIGRNRDFCPFFRFLFSNMEFLRILVHFIP